MKVRPWLLTLLGAALFSPLSMAGTPPGLRSGACWDSLFAEVDTLRLEGRQEDALSMLRELLRDLESDPTIPLWRRGDAQTEITTLEFVLTLDPDLRRECSYADSLTVAVTDCWMRGRFDEGADTARRQLEIQRRILGQEHPDVATTINNLALLLLMQAKYEEAGPLAREALAMHRRLRGRLHPEIAISVNNLACILKDQGKYSQAEPLYREALGLAIELWGRNDPSLAMNLNNLGVIFWYQGDFAAAEPLFREALAMRRQTLEPDHPDVAQSINNLAFLLNAQGDYAGAEGLYRELIAMRRASLGEEHPVVAGHLNNLANTLTAQERFADAEPFYREALGLRRQLLGPEHPDIAESLNDLAGLLSERGEAAAAADLYAQALAMRRKLLGAQHPKVATSLSGLSIHALRQGDFSRAERLAREALDICRAIHGAEHLEVAQALSNLGGVLLAQGDPHGAWPHLKSAAATFEAARIRAGSGLTRATFQTSPYLKLAATHLLRGATEEAWPAAEHALGRALSDLLIAAGERALTPIESAREDSLKGRLAQLEGQHSALRQAALNDSTPEADERAAEARNALLAAEADWSAFQRQIAANHPVTAGQAYPLERVQASLPPHAALIGWLHVEVAPDAFSSWAYIVKPSEPVVWITLQAGESDRRVPHADCPSAVQPVCDLHTALEVAGSWPFRVTAATRILGQAQRVYSDWVAPLMPHLVNVTHLIAIPSEPLLGIPLAALIDEENHPLGRRFTISYAPSATIYTWLREQDSAETAWRAQRAFLVGDPPFSSAHLAAMEREAAGEPSRPAPPLLATGIMRSALSGDARALCALPRLPATRKEIERLANLVPEATTLLGREASEQRLATMAGAGQLRQFDTIHLATHGLNDPDRPERSALAFAQTDLPDPLAATAAGERIFDGLLTAKEIIREWDLCANLVTLSGCQTGLGRKAAGEGYVGLAHAFLQAGARSLLVSLWKVDDEATSLLMSRFYENLTGRGQGRTVAPQVPAAALREAQAHLRDYTDPEGAQPFRHPAFWSGFILIGDAG